MDNLVLSLAPLAGVAFGAYLSYWLTATSQSRGEIAFTFREAETSVAYAHASHMIYMTDPADDHDATRGWGEVGPNDPRPGHLSRSLTQQMANERNRALITARGALSRLVPYDRRFET
ncbi:MAG: hypothetical protein L0Y54_16930 [Sporichthyaceae bacterium]|nr:hypothetical protein [Sporichthyaceae bacterium]